MALNIIIIGLLMIIAGVLALKYNYQLTNSFGTSVTLTKYMGSGSEYGLFKLLSILLIVIGFIVMFGFGDNVLNFLLSPLKVLFNGLANQQ